MGLRRLRWIMVAGGLSWGEVLEAWEVLAGSQTGEDGGHRSQEEAWAGEGLSYLEAQVDLRERKRRNFICDLLVSTHKNTTRLEKLHYEKISLYELKKEQ